MPGKTNVGAEGKNKLPRKKPNEVKGDPRGHKRRLPKKKVKKSAEEKRLLAHKEMTKDEAYMAPKALAEKKRLKAHKEMTKDEAYSDPTPGHGRHPQSKAGEPVRRETKSKPTVKDSKGNPVKGGGGNVTWSGGSKSGFDPLAAKKARESRRRGGRAGYAGGGIALRGFGSTRKI